MNKTSIEWTDRTWNPVTGCLHPCRNIYCYNTIKSNSVLNRFGATYFDDGQKKVEHQWRKRQTGGLHIAKKGEIYPYGYDPTFYPHRLEEPLGTKGRLKIFVVDTGDLFGAWVPDEWIEKVMGIAKACQNHVFQFLTKNPRRLLEIDFPANSWVGVSATSNKDREAVNILREVKASVRFLSMEPLLEGINFGLNGFQWIIIGAQTGTNPVRPEKTWIDGILKKADRQGTPVFMKSNISPYHPSRLRQLPIPPSTK